MSIVTITPNISYIIDGGLDDLLDESIMGAANNHIASASEVVTGIMDVTAHLETIAVFMTDAQSAVMRQHITKLRQLAYGLTPITINK